MGFKDNSNPEPEQVEVQTETSTTSSTAESPKAVKSKAEKDKDDSAKLKLQSKSGKKKESKLPSKKTLIVIASVVGIILLMLIVKLVGGGKSKEDFFSITNTILDNEMGSFTYTFDVRTYPLGTDVTEDSEIVDDGVEKEQQTSEGGKANMYNVQNSEWGNTDGTQVKEWEYPKYCVTFSGRVVSKEPYSMTMKVNIATEGFNDLFTEITTYEDKYYINVEQMHYWLKSSGDAYLKSLGSKLPEGSKYLVVPANEMGWMSMFTEEDETAVIKNLETLLRRVTTYQDVVLGQLESSVSVQSNNPSEGVYEIVLTDQNKLASSFKSLFDRYGDLHKNYLSKAKEKGLYTEEEYTQALAELDNILAGMEDTRRYLNTADLGSLGIELTGNARHYNSISGVDTFESTIRATWQTDKVYDIQVSLSRDSSGSAIELPVGSTMTRDKLTSPTLVFDTVYSMIEYFNPTSIKLHKQLDVTNTSVKADVLQYLITMVNNSEYTNSYITQNSVLEFIDMYKSAETLPKADLEIYNDHDFQKIMYAGDEAIFRGFDVDNLDGIITYAIENGCTEDLINHLYVYCYFVYLNNVTDGLILQVEVREEDVVESREDFEVTINDCIKATVAVNEEETNTQLLCLDLTLCNTDLQNSYSIDVSNMYVQDLVGSIYPVNSEVLLLNYDNNWDVSKSPATIIVPQGTYNIYKLYILVNSMDGYLDLRYNDQLLGVIQAY